MSEASPNEATSTEAEKPVQANDDILCRERFPPFPDPTDDDFEEDISVEERNYYKEKFPDINAIKDHKLHCTACDRHLGCSARNEARMRSHPMLRTLVCNTCHSFYNSGEFDKGDDGSELYCRWCGQGGQVYCCSDCCHVFCAKCIKRNLGVPKIKEIENTDDWKCFKCMPRCLWDMRAVCWALLRYCDLKNKIAYTTQDPQLKEAYQKDCALDLTECCKSKLKKKEKADAKKKEAENSKRALKEAENSTKQTAASAITKIPPTIQVKKFASINLDDSPKEKKAQKRPLSPKNKIIMKNPISIAPAIKLLNPGPYSPGPKKMRMTAPNILNPIRVQKDRQPCTTYTRIRPKMQQIPMGHLNNQFNGYNSPIYHNIPACDNINLSLESLTQGLDMAAVAHMAGNPQHDDLLCTPDFPLEPLCEVTEDNTDDDVQCITPGPIAGPKLNTPLPPLVPRLGTNFNDVPPSENVIQMTENDVTVNAATGGLKFRVDPQTLSSNKMYRLPDGRVFAINANPNMPGGYSATIVALADTSGKVNPKGATYAAKLSAVSSSPQVAPPPQISTPITHGGKPTQSQASRKTKRGTPKTHKSSKGKDSSRKCDLNVPIEWYRYNLIDAVDALEYSLARLQKLRKEATTMYLRTRTLPEMRGLHKNLERLLNTSSTRFNEIKHNLNKEMKQYVVKKMGSDNNNISDDDDVEILNDLNVNDDPIFIDENSVDSIINESIVNETQEVDLTGVGSSEHNESGGKSFDQADSFDKDPVDSNTHTVENGKNYAKASVSDDDNVSIENVDSNTADNGETSAKAKVSDENNVIADADGDNKNETANGNENLEQIVDKNTEHDDELEKKDKEQVKKTDTDGNLDNLDDILNDSNEKNVTTNEDKVEDKTEDEIQDSKVSESKLEESQITDDKMEDIDMSEDKTQDAEMSEEMIETLLKEDCGDDGGTIPSLNCLEIPDEIKEP